MAPGELCFDIGANVGNRASIFLALGARVVAVEPLEECQRVLTERFGRDARFTLVGAALGPEPGSSDIWRPAEVSTLGSMSREWIEQVRESGRFASFDWTVRYTVDVTTLDALVERFGLPAFCKIDVEGYEHEVLSGLSTPLPAVSLEFTPERLASTEAAVQKLDSLAAYEYNYSLNESLRLALPRWVDGSSLRRELTAYADDAVVFGDVYARKSEPSGRDRLGPQRSVG